MEGKTIVVADDHPVVVEMVAALLERRGYAVVRATDGEQALAAIRDHEPDLVILDAEMPAIDGWDVLERLRAGAGGAAPPVVMLSADESEAARSRALAAGARDYFVKPIRPREFADRIAALVAAAG